MTLLVSVEASSDISEAVQWLGDRSPELPERFRVALEEVFQRVSEFPQMYPVVHRSMRRAFLRHFPWSVFYMVVQSDILVLGVIHQARHPSVWRQRSPN